MDGTLAPKPGETPRSAHVPVDQQRLHYAQHPPTCLGVLRCVPTQVPGFRFDGHGEPVNAVFAVRCPCGGADFDVFGYYDDRGESSPEIVLVCDQCEAEHKVFDAACHGFDGALNPRRRPLPIGDAHDLWSGGVIVRFEFFADLLGRDRHRGREHELFSWITIVGTTEDPRASPRFLFEWECA